MFSVLITVLNSVVHFYLAFRRRAEIMVVIKLRCCTNSSHLKGLAQAKGAEEALWIVKVQRKMDVYTITQSRYQCTLCRYLDDVTASVLTRYYAKHVLPYFFASSDVRMSAGY